MTEKKLLEPTQRYCGNLIIQEIITDASALLYNYELVTVTAVLLVKYISI